MKPHPQRADVVARLKEQRIDFIERPAGPSLRFVATRLGGRVFAFDGDTGESLFWLNDAFGDAQAFAAFVARRDWNIGGDRVWIGPEIQFITRERLAEPGASPGVVPPEMDPGQFGLADGAEADSAYLGQSVTLPSQTVAGAVACVRIERLITPVGDPLAGSELTRGRFIGGYAQSILIRMDPTAGRVAPASWWSVTNLRPRGNVYFAATPGVRTTDFIAPAPPELRLAGHGYIGGRLTGDRGYKLGFSAPHMMGRFAYLWDRPDGRAHLFVRTCTARWDGRFLEEAAHQPGYTGAAGFIYNDSGGLGGFGEFECMGAAIGLPDGPRLSNDHLSLWIYTGTPAQLAPIARELLGVEILAG